MNIRILRPAAAQLAALVASGGIAAIAADWNSSSSKRADVKRTSDNATADDAAAPARTSKLVPFPEDLVAKPTAQPARRSDFQPRFKPPAVRQAQHVEPVGEAASDGPKLLPVPDEEDAPATDAKAGGTAKPDDSVKPADNVKPADGDGAADELHGAERTAPLPKEADSSKKGPSTARALVDEAFAKSKLSSTEKDFSEVIDLCRRAMGLGLGKQYDDYSRRLLGWAYNRRGEAIAKDGRDKEALADFEAAVEASGSWRAIHNRGVSYAALGRVGQAMADLDRAIHMNARYPNAYFNRGELKYKQGDFAGALADYTAALKLNPKDSTTLNSRGHALYRMERFGEALRDYGEAIKIDPDNVAALINRADTYSDMGQYSEAAKDYRAAIRIAPKMGRAYHSAAWFMATCPDQHYRNEKLAVEAARRAIALDGEDYRNLSTLAAAEASAGLFAEAKETQEKAIKKASQADVVTAEKMMGLYQRDLAFRERPRTAFKPPEEMDDAKVQQASGTSGPGDATGKWPTRQASGTTPARPTPRNRY
jgi:tetratricopeptide (TPR) repeat protein